MPKPKRPLPGQLSKRVRKQVRELARQALWKRAVPLSAIPDEPDMRAIERLRTKPKEELKHSMFQKEFKRESRQLEYQVPFQREAQHFSRMDFGKPNPKAKRLADIQRRQRTAEYQRHASWLRRKMPSALLSSGALQIARQKLTDLMDAPEAVCRVENLAKVVSQLKYVQPLDGEEAFYLENPKEWLEKWKNVNKTPNERTQELVKWASDFTRWPNHLYNCMVFYDYEALNDRFYRDKDSLRKIPWGETFIQETKQPSILGIMVFDSNPKTLVKLANQIAKRRLRDPLPIFDIHGNIFYP